MRLVSRSGLIATTLAIGAVAVPNAQAGGLFSTGPDPNGADQQEAQSFLRIYGASNSNPVPDATSTNSPSNGFDYSDAAVGAGVVAGLALLGTAGALTVRRRSELRRP